jgi:S-adenosylmethionine:tRNA ribosyltransferase-isomerase
VRLVVIPRAGGQPTLVEFRALPSLLRAGDLVIVNDAATLPASLVGRTASGVAFELRLSAPVDGARLRGVAFGAGDHRTRTEDRAAPPELAIGERVTIGAARTIAATVVAARGRIIELDAWAPAAVGVSAADALWQQLYAAGRPIQYAHRDALLPLWSVQTAYAARPWSAEMPSAGRPLTWDVLLGLRRAGVAIATLTHAAGLSSTGDAALDRALPWPERYELPARTIAAIAAARARGGRVIAVGTTVVRALEAAALRNDGDHVLAPGPGVATLRLDGAHHLRVIDGLISGLHVPGESHFDLLQAFAKPTQLTAALELAGDAGLSSHELGDACLLL